MLTAFTHGLAETTRNPGYVMIGGPPARALLINDQVCSAVHTSTYRSLRATGVRQKERELAHARVQPLAFTRIL